MSKNINLTVPTMEDITGPTKKGWAATKGFLSNTKEKVEEKKRAMKKANLEKMIFSDNRADRVAMMETVVQLAQGEQAHKRFLALSNKQQDQVIAQFQAQLEQENNKEESK